VNPNTEEARRLAGVLRKVIPYEGNEWDLDEAARQLCALADEVERLEADRRSSEMRALMVLVADEIISSDRAREIVAMTHEEQREHWRREHKQALDEKLTILLVENGALRAANRRMADMTELPHHPDDFSESEEEADE